MQQTGKGWLLSTSAVCAVPYCGHKASQCRPHSPVPCPVVTPLPLWAGYGQYVVPVPIRKGYERSCKKIPLTHFSFTSAHSGAVTVLVQGNIVLRGACASRGVFLGQCQRYNNKQRKADCKAYSLLSRQNQGLSIHQK